MELEADGFSAVKRKVGAAAKVRRARQGEARLPCGCWAAALQEPGSRERAPGHEAVTVRKMPGGSRDCSVLESILETVLKEV